jgi:ferredoxin
MTATPTIEIPTIQSVNSLPTLPNAIVDAEASQEIMRTLRHFHLGNPAALETLEGPTAELLPALLEPFRDTSRLRYDYPLFLFPADNGDADRPVGELAKPLSALLAETVESFAPGAESARILKDNLSWIERHLRIALGEAEGPAEALPLLNRSATELQAHLALKEKNRDKLQQDLDKLLEALPAGGQLLGYGRYPAIQLLIHVIRSRVIPRHTSFRKAIKKQIQQLKTLIEVDWSKSSESLKPDNIRTSVGSLGEMFDVSKLSEVMDHSHGSVVMPVERRRRIDNALQILENYQQQSTLVHFVHTGALEDESWLSKMGGFVATRADDPCASATELFDQEATRLSQVFAAVRIAKLEIAGLYDTDIHDPWFENFGWEAFSHDELLLVPSVIALESADRVAGNDMPSFSHLLSSGRPVQILVRVLAHGNPGALPNEDPFQSYRTELGYLGISHRQAVVAQASAARHQHLLESYSSALDATRTSLHLINIGLRPAGQNIGLNAWLVAGAALEGRVHPFFRVNPAAGDSFAERMDLSGNPQPERDWPLHPFRYRNESGDIVNTELAFTFADYALLIPRLHNHFAQVPLECESDDLIPVADYLQLDASSAYEKVPFVWTLNPRAKLHRLAISRALVHACRDRLNFWHTLQEMGGVRNRYVELALEQARGEHEAAAETKIEQVRAEYEQELERIRAETAGEVMSRLTDMLLGMDFGSGVLLHPTSSIPGVVSSGAARPMPAAVTAGPSSAAIPEAKAEQPEAAAVTESEEEEPGGYEEPWIDSPLCTTCNDCLKINPQMFVYDESNQAYIADLSAGTYAQMVEAAEICPSKCIHPGKPWNSDEPNLDALIERAAPFN